MSIPAVNLSYVGQGPTGNGQTIADQRSGPIAKQLVGFGTATLDGSLTTFDVNFIDGTKTPFGTWSGPAGNQVLTATAPFAVIVERITPSTDTAASTISAYAGVPTTVKVPVVISGAGSNGQLLSFLVYIVPYSS